jgi:serpin B
MPYSGGDLSMLVLLPHAPSGLGDLEKKLTLEKLKAIIGKLHPESEVDVSFPKFKLDASVNLRQALTQMGMPTVFSNSADLSGIDGAKNLFVTDVIHRAYVRVDETGTEAATATAVPIAVLGGSPLPARPTFCADHPFLFVIMDRKNGTILFIGRVVHPAD